MAKCERCKLDVKKLIKHHINYLDDVIIYVCDNCHRIIHSKKGEIKYKPVNRPTERTIKITENTHSMLCRVGQKGETFDEIINRLILERKEKEVE